MILLNNCLDKGIRLISIFEDDWVYKSDIVKSRVKNIMGYTSRKIYARNCIVKKIDNNTSKSFLDTNHLQGCCDTRYNYGLFYNDELVSVMNFGKYRKCTGRNNVLNEYEMYRYCNSLDTVVIGGASKLLKYFINTVNPSKIISYADRCWSNGNLYEKLGFKMIRNTVPNYWYILNYKRENRYKWRKSELSKVLKNYNPELTEHQNMYNNGHYRIYDCGSILYELDLKV